MLKIRLSRTGRRNQTHYRIVVTERRSKRDGSNVAELGYYIPYTSPAVLKIDVKQYDEWIGKGAQTSDVVSYLRSKTKTDKEVEIEKKAKKKKSKKALKRAEAEKEAAATPAA